MARHSLGLWPGPEARPGPETAVEIVMTECSAILRGLSDAAEDSRCTGNGCPIKRRSERNRMSDLQSAASDRAPIFDS